MQAVATTSNTRREVIPTLRYSYEYGTQQECIITGSSITAYEHNLAARRAIGALRCGSRERRGAHIDGRSLMATEVNCCSAVEAAVSATSAHHGIRKHLFTSEKIVRQSSDRPAACTHVYSAVVAMSSMSAGGMRGAAAKPPEKGVFPLDHFGECTEVGPRSQC